MARNVMGASTDGDRQILGPCKSKGGPDIDGAPAANDDGGTAINHAVPHGAGMVISRIGRGQQLAGD
jgi:hypothetical protein